MASFLLVTPFSTVRDFQFLFLTITENHQSCYYPYKARRPFVWINITYNSVCWVISRCYYMKDSTEHPSCQKSAEQMSLSAQNCVNITFSLELVQTEQTILSAQGSADICINLWKYYHSPKGSSSLFVYDLQTFLCCTDVAICIQ